MLFASFPDIVRLNSREGFNMLSNQIYVFLWDSWLTDFFSLFVHTPHSITFAQLTYMTPSPLYWGCPRLMLSKPFVFHNYFQEILIGVFPSGFSYCCAFSLCLFLFFTYCLNKFLAYHSINSNTVYIFSAGHLHL